jgi:hypothetical protein
MVSTCRYQFVLYNTEATRHIHPVSDNALFEAPLSHYEKTALVQESKKKRNRPRDSKPAQELIRTGYKFSDSAHVRQLCMHGVGGVQVYYFNFSIAPVPSVVNCEDPGLLVSELQKYELEDEEAEKERQHQGDQGREGGGEEEKHLEAEMEE